MQDGLELFFKTEAVGITAEADDLIEDREHVLRDDCIHGPHVCEIKATVNDSIVL